MMMFKVIMLAVIVTLCSTQETDENSKQLGHDRYLPCKRCNIPRSEYPEEGYMACYHVRRGNKTVPGRVEKCKQVCVGNIAMQDCKDVCSYQRKNVLMLECELERKSIRMIPQKSEKYGTIYQVNSPQYFGYKEYPKSTFCIWNVANDDAVTYRIIDQRLQEPKDCDTDGCDCPDSMVITMGSNVITLCGDEMPSITNQISHDGLRVEFCSDVARNTKGVLVMAYKHNTTDFNVMPLQPHTVEDSTETRRRRQQPDSCQKQVNEMSSMISQMGCQYEYMMRMSQPGTPCPDDKTILTLMTMHDFLMGNFTQSMQMCDGMENLSTRMPMMNNIESCAVDYLYRTRDCAFAKKLIDTTSGELSDVARMIANNNFPIKAPKWMNITRTNCKKHGRDDE